MVAAQKQLFHEELWDIKYCTLPIYIWMLLLPDKGFLLSTELNAGLDYDQRLQAFWHRLESLKVNAVTIGGDLFSQKYLHSETVNFIHQQLSILSPIRVIISPGENDPFINESPYARLNWPENVDIFYQSKLTSLKLADNIYLWGASNPLTHDNKFLDHVKLESGVNLLLLHVSFNRNDGATDIDKLRSAGFRLALLGGEHNGEKWMQGEAFYVVPGSPEPLSMREESGLHQTILIEIDGENLKLTL